MLKPVMILLLIDYVFLKGLSYENSKIFKRQNGIDNNVFNNHESQALSYKRD